MEKNLFMSVLHVQLSPLHLLKHAFYQAWTEGKVPMETLKVYSKEYYHHVAAFPRYLSQIHALCSDLKSRQILLENLIDEERGENNHPELWARFSEGLGVTRGDIAGATPQLEATKALVDGYFDLVKKDYATGLGAIYAYEYQTPEVVTSKIKGLKDHYNVHDASTLEFFTVHQGADEWHTEEVAHLIQALSASEQKKVSEGAQAGAKLLWNFLDEMASVMASHTGAPLSCQHVH